MAKNHDELTVKGCGCGMAPKPAYAACFRTPRCHLMAPNWKVDHHRVSFCNKWARFAPDLCPEVADPCQEIHEPLQGMDHFSHPPLYRRSMCEPKFRYHRATFEPDPCAGNCKLSCSCCPGIPQLPSCYHRPKPKPYGDVICGLCVNNEYGPKPQPRPCGQGDGCGGPEAGENTPDDPCEAACDLPFVVYPLFNPCQDSGKPKRKISGAERCLHPSDMRYLDTNYKMEFTDFFKTRTREDIELYRGHLAIDIRRARPTIPKENSDSFALDMNQPIYVNARPIRWKGTGKPERKSYSVSVPGPITLCI